ncbi:MAG TPA: outer membrane beta-barrel protein [Gemmatimonadota bacterium]|nr:outer membrane beta-barrel protein [Gemmatimonadota bacterium]
MACARQLLLPAAGLWTISVLTAAALLATATPASAQVRLTLSPYIGVFFYDEGALRAFQGDDAPEAAFEVDPARFLGAKVGVVLLDRLAIEGDLGFASLSGDEEDVGDIDLGEIDGDLTLYSIGARLNLTPNSPLNLFLTAGVGGATTDFDLQETDSFTDVIVTVGGGATYPITDYIRLRGDVRSVVQFCEDADEAEFGHCLEESSLTHTEFSGGAEFTLF